MKKIATLIKESYGGLSTEMWLLAFTQFINRCGTMVVFFLAIYLSEELLFDLNRVGLLMGIYGAGALLGVYVGGKFTDRIGYYPVLLTSLFAGGAMFFVVYHVRNFYALATALFVLNALSEAFRPANIVASYFYSTPETYTRAVSLNRLAINLGFSISPIIGSVLAEKGFQYVFWMDGATCIGAGFIVLFYLKNFKKEKAPDTEANDKVHSPWRDKPFLFFLPLIMLYAGAFFQIFSIMSIYFVEVEHLNKMQLGSLLALNGLIVAGVEMVFIYKFQNRWSMYNFIVTGVALLLISYLLITVAHGYIWLLLFFILISFSEILAMPFMNTYMNGRSGEHNKGEYASLYVMAWSLAQIIMPVMATSVISGYGYNTLWIILALICTLVIFGFKRLQQIS